jgi:hypothetical protein
MVLSHLWIYESLLKSNNSKTHVISLGAIGKSIDLVEDQTVKNPILQRSIDRNKKLIYG